MITNKKKVNNMINELNNFENFLEDFLNNKEEKKVEKENIDKELKNSVKKKNSLLNKPKINISVERRKSHFFKNSVNNGIFKKKIKKDNKKRKKSFIPKIYNKKKLKRSCSMRMKIFENFKKIIENKNFISLKGAFLLIFQKFQNQKKISRLNHFKIKFEKIKLRKLSINFLNLKKYLLSNNKKNSSLKKNNLLNSKFSNEKNLSCFTFKNDKNNKTHSKNSKNNSQNNLSQISLFSFKKINSLLNSNKKNSFSKKKNLTLKKNTILNSEILISKSDINYFKKNNNKLNFSNILDQKKGNSILEPNGIISEINFNNIEIIIPKNNCLNITSNVNSKVNSKVNSRKNSKNVSLDSSDSVISSFEKEDENKKKKYFCLDNKDFCDLEFDKDFDDRFYCLDNNRKEFKKNIDYNKESFILKSHINKDNFSDFKKNSNKFEEDTLKKIFGKNIILKNKKTLLKKLAKNNILFLIKNLLTTTNVKKEEKKKSIIYSDKYELNYNNQDKKDKDSKKLKKSKLIINSILDSRKYSNLYQDSNFKYELIKIVNKNNSNKNSFADLNKTSKTDLNENPINKNFVISEKFIITNNNSKILKNEKELNKLKKKDNSSEKFDEKNFGKFQNENIIGELNEKKNVKKLKFKSSLSLNEILEKKKYKSISCYLYYFERKYHKKNLKLFFYNIRLKRKRQQKLKLNQFLSKLNYVFWKKTRRNFKKLKFIK